MPATHSQWPKTPPVLNPAQLLAREQFMRLWHEELPLKYGIVENFNHRSVATLPIKSGIKTLEVGAGLGEHSRFEQLSVQEYYCLDYRQEFCNKLLELFPADRVHLGDIHQKQAQWADGAFDRIVAVHVLEHLVDLPSALAEISRLLKDDGFFDVVLPCEGGLAYSMARKISAQRFFEKRFKMDYIPIVRNEHVNTFAEIMELMPEYFTAQIEKYFPLKVRVPTINLCAAFRFVKRLVIQKT